MTDSTICKIPPGTRVLVTGATGFTGIVLTRKLVEAGLDVQAIARASSDLTPLAGMPIRWYRGDVFDPKIVARAAAETEYIFHLAAAFREAKSSEKDYWNVHVKSTQLLAREALKTNKFKCFIHVSTIGVHGHIEQGPADESYRFAPGDGYQRTKAEAEKWLAPFASSNELPYTIIRPAAIYGPGDRRLVKLFKMATWKIFPLLGKGKCLYHLIHVDDLTNAFIIAATTPAALNEAIICGADHPIPIAEIAQVVSHTLGKRTKVVRLPVKPFFWAADLCEGICKPIHIEPPLYRRRVAFYTKDRHFDTAKLKRVLGYHPKWSNEDGIAQTARWYVEQGWLRG
jgi:nucleoside-diphosphate-sugar epimerase